MFEQAALPLLESVCKGFNATLLAYGQTGSGKTHTICGDLVGDNQGIIPRVAQYLLDQLDKNKLDQVQFSVLEVYLGELYDLSSRTQNVSKLTIRERPNGDTFVQNLRTFSLVDFDDFVKRFQTASEIRKVAATRQNDRSTRSHLIATFRVQGVNSQGVRFDSLFNLGDLSGSERVAKSGVEGKEFEQAVNINLDLHSLRTVVLRIKEKGFPSFRENALTRLLQNSIEGNCKTRIIFAVRTEPESINDTTGTLQFALDCSFLKNKVSVRSVKTIESLERQLVDQAQAMADLKIENARLKMENGQLKKELEGKKERGKGVEVVGTETEMVLEEEEEASILPVQNGREPAERKVTLSTVDQWTQPPSSSSNNKPRAKPAPIDTTTVFPATTGLELVAQRIRRKHEVSKSLPADLSVFASVANTQTQLNLQVVKLENELMAAKQQVERLTGLLNQQQRK